MYSSALFGDDVVIPKPIKALHSLSELCVVIVIIKLLAKLRSLPINLGKIALDHPFPKYSNAKKQFPLR